MVALSSYQSFGFGHFLEFNALALRIGYILFGLIIYEQANIILSH